MSDTEPRTISLKVACLNLRHKGMYSDDSQDVRGLVDDSLTMIPYFCAATHDALGPDNDPVGPKECRPERGCYRGQGK